MGLISTLLGFKALSLEDPSQPLLPMSALFESLGLGRSDAGVLINEKQAMRLSTTLACVKIISEDLSRLSLDIHQNMPDGSIRTATEHRLYPVLHDRPNPNMSSMVWRGAAIAATLTHGNAYTFVKRDNASRVVALIPLDPGKTSPVKIKGELMYATTQTDSGEVTYIDPANILHFRNFPVDNTGILGQSPIQLCKNAFGLGIAQEKYGAQFFGNGARASGVLTHPQHLDPEAYENLKKSVHEWATGETALRPIILEEGMTWNQISIKPDEAQFIEGRKFSKESIAEMYRVPMHLLQDLGRSSLNNIEHQGLDYVRFCLSPRAVDMEGEITFKLLGKGYSCQHNFMELQRGDFASQTTGLIALRQAGIFSANDCLRQMKQNPIPVEEGGDIRLVQGAMIPLESLAGNQDIAVAETTDSDTGQPAATQRMTIMASYRTLYRDALGRSMNRKSDPEFVKKAFQPIVASLAQTLLAARFGTAELTDADKAKVTHVVDAIVTASPGWTKEKASEIATNITEQCYDALIG